MCVCCFSELKFGKQSGIPIVPALVEGDGWRPTGWLGLVVAGTLWSPISADDFDGGVAALVSQIKKSVPTDAIAEEDDDTGHVTGDELRAELARLHADLQGGHGNGNGNGADGHEPEAATFDSSKPAVLPTNVPSLPGDYRETDAVAELREILLLEKGDANFRTRVGFFGMGVSIQRSARLFCAA